jgi:DNA-binding MarR family transcriptional regulator
MPDPEPAPPLLLYMVKQVELAVRARLDDIVRPFGLTALQYTALTVLERHADMSSAQLARSSFVTAQSMADMIAALESRGLIERHRDRDDRRRLVVALTSGGRVLLDRCRDEVLALEHGMLNGLSDQQAAALRTALSTCHANLSREASQAGSQGRTAVYELSTGGRVMVVGALATGSSEFTGADRPPVPDVTTRTA